MHVDSGTNLLDLPVENVRQWLKKFDVVLTDCDGVLWHDNTPIGGSPELVGALQRLGKRVYFVTNNGTKTRRAIWQRATALGYDVDEGDIIAPTHTIVEYLKQRNFQKRAYVVGPAAIAEELDGAGIGHIGSTIDLLDVDVNDYIERELCSSNPDVGAVIIGFDENFTFGKMMKASNYLGSDADCLFLATNMDAVHKYPRFHIPGTGAILKAVETCVGRDALVLGKPNPVVCEALLEQGALVPERALMIGDCCMVDVPFGKNCGFQTLLVGTGSTSQDDLKQMLQNPQEHRQHIPDFYVDKMGDLLQFI